ncbi:MAG TPA: hypothetical protein VNC41_09965 [Acidimicrobiia bacterium]|nr:hypothetical protein [Acidimicrobiia bacterium]
MHYVEVIPDRPDFRVFIDLLYGHGRNVDTDGDAEPVSSRGWTWLYLKDRESEDPSVTISADEETPTSYRIESASVRLEELTALYLFLHCGRSIWTAERQLHDEEVDALENRYRAELQRALASIWHQSTLRHPYPKLPTARS